jgi:hypothetical protein
MSKVSNQQKKSLKITRDSGANLTILKELEKHGCIEIHDVLGENETVKVENKSNPVAVVGHCKLGDGSVYAGNDCKYSGIVEVIGKDNIQDARKLETHVRYKHDYFVTEDKDDILSNWLELKNKFGIKVIDPEKLKELCQ